MKKIEGFTLIELLAVIVILSIILAIALPGITDLISNAKKNAFGENIKIVIKSIDNKRISDGNYNVNDLGIDNMQTALGIDSSNYESISALMEESNVRIDAVGKNQWDGLEAHGTIENLEVVEKGSWIEPTPAACFTFNSATKTITDYDFVNCTKDVVIPNALSGVTIEHIGPGAFIKEGTQYCYTEDNQVEVPIDYVHGESDGYEGCYFDVNWDDPNLYDDTLTSVKLPTHLKTIEYSAFGYNQISTIVIPNCVTFIGQEAFFGGSLSNVTIPNTVTEIEPWAFAANFLTNVTIPNSLTELSAGIFAWNTITDVVIPNNISIIGQEAFEENQLTSVEIPNGVTTIGELAFSANRLMNITLSNTVTTIKRDAFSNNQLTDIIIPSSVSIIYDRAFSGNSFSSVTIQGTNPQRFNTNWLSIGFPQALMPE